MAGYRTEADPLPLGPPTRELFYLSLTQSIANIEDATCSPPDAAFGPLVSPGLQTAVFGFVHERLYDLPPLPLD